MRTLEILQIAIPVACSCTSVNQNIRSRDESSTTTHKEFSQVAYFIWRTCTTCRRRLNHLEITLFARTMQLIIS